MNTSERHPARRGLTSRHISAIDGLRALAVAAVFLYHLGASWIPGGFLGVDLFFVISGYVITRLILDTYAQRGAIRLRTFYLARFYRLIPALITLVIPTWLYISIFARDTLRRLLADLPFVFTGTNNWRLVALHQDYFQQNARPPLLQHTWSLAVESQFYLLWPLMLIGVLRYFKKRNVTIVSLLIAGISGFALSLFSLRLDENSTNQVSHIYFGTDTHSIGLFLGSALAVSWIPANFTRDVGARAQDFIDGVGIVGLLGLLATFLFIDESNPTLYKIAFPAAAIFGCAIIMSLVHPASRFAPLLSNRALLWIGHRSYSIYLWHWVIFQLTRPSIDFVGRPIAVLALRVLLVLALADISYRVIEKPFRRGRVQTWFRGLRYKPSHERSRIYDLVAIGIVSLAILLFSTTVAAFHAPTTALSTGQSPHQSSQNLAGSDDSSSPQMDPLGKGGYRLWVEGDSVILGIRALLEQHHHISLMNARVGRQLPELVETIRADQPQAEGRIAIINAGNNGRIRADEFALLMRLLAIQPKVIVVNSAAPRKWRDENNRIIASEVAKYPNARLVDWRRNSSGHPEFFAPDGVHLSPEGGMAYVAGILSALDTAR